MAVYKPSSEAELVEVIADAAAAGHRLDIRGGGSKRDIGAPTEADTLDLSAFTGVIDYDPAELVLTAGAATPLVEIEALLAEHGQMLAFEPFDPGPMFGRPIGAATLGGSIAAGLSGSRRLSRGSARDHLLGFKAVSGRGEALIGGAKVVKNVTGYDLPKLMAGSWGRLAALTEVSVKVLPRPETQLTLAADSLDPRAACALMAKAIGSQAEVAAAAFVDGLTALRLEGFGPSVAARRIMLEALAPQIHLLTDGDADEFWSILRNPLPDAPVLLRALVPTGKYDPLTERIQSIGPDLVWAMDWAGGLVWIGADPATARAAVEPLGGHAMIWRAPVEVRASTPTLHPQPSAVAKLEARVRRAFDPSGVFETGRFGTPHAD